MQVMDKKECRRCHEVKPLGGFYVHPEMDDGHLNFCKTCKKTEAIERYHRLMRNPEWVERERARSRKRAKSRFQKRNAKKRSANTAVSNALRDGRLAASEACGDCGHDFRHSRREGHHSNYNKPLEVEWLCSLCHGKRHRRRKP